MAVCSETFSISRVNINTPKGLEVTVVQVRSKQQEVASIPIFVFSIYSSPRSKYNSQLIDFLMMQISNLKTSYPKASFILGGDRNSIPLDTFSNLYPGIHQINTKPTRQNKILDFICTDN